MKVKTECSSCRGTGLYVGFAEPSGTAVICQTCGGTGCNEISYTPFASRKAKAGIKVVKYSQGSMVALGVGPVGNSITYAEFQAGKTPKR